MDRQQTHPTIKTLDNLPRVLFWEIDDFLCLACPIFLGIVFGCLSIALAGLVIKPIYGKIKRKMPCGTYKHRIYWMIPTRVLKGMIKTIPPSHNREYLL
jgi:type IV conjugative transfer system protein TraL